MASMQWLERIKRIRHLSTILRDKSDSYSKIRAIQSLALEGKQAIPLLVEATHDQNYLVRGSALISLGEIANQKTIKLIQKSLKDDNSHVRGCAIEALGNLKHKESAMLLIGLLEGTGTQDVAIVALGKIDDMRAIEPIKKIMLENSSLKTRQAAASSLQSLGWEPENKHEKTVFFTALGDWAQVLTLGDSVVEHLLVELKESYGHHQLEVAKTLGLLGNNIGISHLISISTAKDKGVAFITSNKYLTEILEQSSSLISTEKLEELSQ